MRAFVFELRNRIKLDGRSIGSLTMEIRGERQHPESGCSLAGSAGASHEELPRPEPLSSAVAPSLPDVSLVIQQADHLRGERAATEQGRAASA